MPVAGAGVGEALGASSGGAPASPKAGSVLEDMPPLTSVSLRAAKAKSPLVGRTIDFSLEGVCHRARVVNARGAAEAADGTTHQIEFVSEGCRDKAETTWVKLDEERCKLIDGKGTSVPFRVRARPRTCLEADAEQHAPLTASSLAASGAGGGAGGSGGSASGGAGAVKEVLRALHDSSVGGPPGWRSAGLLAYEEAVADPWKATWTDHATWRCVVDWWVEAGELLATLAVVASFITAPLTFLWGGGWNDAVQMPGGLGTLYTDLCLDIFFAINLLARLNTSYIRPEGRVEIVRLEENTKRLLRSRMYWICWLSVTPYLWIGFGAPLFTNVLKIVRILVLIFPPDSLWRFKGVSSVRVVRLVVVLFAVTHWVACNLVNWGGYREALEERGASAFEQQWLNQTVRGEVVLYFAALAEAPRVLTGSGRYAAVLADGNTTASQGANFGTLVIGSLFGPLGCVVAALVGAAVLHDYVLRVVADFRREEREGSIARALRLLDVPEDLRCRVRSALQYQRSRQDREALAELFDGGHLSPPLRGALLVHRYRDNVLNSSYFRGKEPAYIVAMLGELREQVYVPGDYAARPGDVGREMFFVAHGDFSILVPAREDRLAQHAVHVGVLSRGSRFGEVGLLKDCARCAWLRAEAYAALASLGRPGAEAVWSRFPEERALAIQAIVSTAMKDREHLVRRMQGTWPAAGPDEADSEASDSLEAAKKGPSAALGRARRLLLRHESALNRCAEDYAQGRYAAAPSSLATFIAAPSTAAALSPIGGKSFSFSPAGAAQDSGTAILRALAALQSRVEALAAQQGSLERVVHHALGLQAPSAALVLAQGSVASLVTSPGSILSPAPLALDPQLARRRKARAKVLAAPGSAATPPSNAAARARSPESAPETNPELARPLPNARHKGEAHRSVSSNVSLTTEADKLLK